MGDPLAYLLQMELEPEYRNLVLAAYQGADQISWFQHALALPMPTPRSPEEAAVEACIAHYRGEDPRVLVSIALSRITERKKAMESNERTAKRWQAGVLIGFILGPVLTVLVAFLLSALMGCGVNPAEGQFGPVAVVAEEDSCRVRVRGHGPDGVQRTVRWEMRPCEGKDHEVEIFGREWW